MVDAIHPPFFFFCSGWCFVFVLHPSPPLLALVHHFDPTQYAPFISDSSFVNLVASSAYYEPQERLLVPYSSLTELATLVPQLVDVLPARIFLGGTPRICCLGITTLFKYFAWKLKLLSNMHHDGRSKESRELKKEVFFHASRAGNIGFAKGLVGSVGAHFLFQTIC